MEFKIHFTDEEVTIITEIAKRHGFTAQQAVDGLSKLAQEILREAKTNKNTPGFLDYLIWKAGRSA